MLPSDSLAVFKELFEFHASRGWSAENRSLEVSPSEMAIVIEWTLEKLGFSAATVEARLDYKVDEQGHELTTNNSTALRVRDKQGYCIVDLVGNFNQQAVEDRIMHMQASRAISWQTAHPGWVVIPSMTMADIEPHKVSHLHDLIAAGVSHMQAFDLARSTVDRGPTSRPPRRV